jgi:hypothetical protein
VQIDDPVLFDEVYLKVLLLVLTVDVVDGDGVVKILWAKFGYKYNKATAPPIRITIIKAIAAKITPALAKKLTPSFR